MKRFPSAIPLSFHLARDASNGRAQPQVLVGRQQRKQRVVLRAHAQTTPQPGQVARQRAPVKVRIASSRFQQLDRRRVHVNNVQSRCLAYSCQQRYQCRFACSVVAQNRRDFTVAKRGADAAHRLGGFVRKAASERKGALAKRLGQTVEAQGDAVRLVVAEQTVVVAKQILVGGAAVENVVVKQVGVVQQPVVLVVVARQRAAFGAFLATPIRRKTAEKVRFRNTYKRQQC